MSYIVSARCVRLKCPGVAKSVLMQLADIANDHGVAWPSLDTLCMRTDWSRTAVIEAIAWLEAHRALRGDRSNGRKTVYRLTPDEFQGDRHPDPKEENPYASRTGTRGAPVRVAHSTGTPGAPDRYAKRTLTTKNHQEPSNTPPAPHGGASPAESTETEKPGTPGFEAVADGYPRRAGIDAARRDWDELAPDAQLQAEIARAIQAWIPSTEWQREGGRFVPKLGKFLRDKRWLDAPGSVEARPAAAAPLPPAQVFTPEQLAANGEKARAAAAHARALMGRIRSGTAA